jgi:hypothetical protein
MKPLKVIHILALGGLMALMALMAGCSSTPTAADAIVGAVFDQPIAKVQKASVDALTATGFEIKKQEPTYVEGTRPRKVGLFVDSGGETVGVWLVAQAPDKTEVKLTTATTLVGAAGQKSWDSEVMAEITKTLGTPTK